MMPRYKYQTYYAAQQMKQDELLNVMGNDGWRLVAVVSYSPEGGTMLYFEKPWTEKDYAALRV